MKLRLGLQIETMRAHLFLFPYLPPPPTLIYLYTIFLGESISELHVCLMYVSLNLGKDNAAYDEITVTK